MCNLKRKLARRGLSIKVAGTAGAARRLSISITFIRKPQRGLARYLFFDVIISVAAECNGAQPYSVGLMTKQVAGDYVMYTWRY